MIASVLLWASYVAVHICGAVLFIHFIAQCVMPLGGITTSWADEEAQQLLWRCSKAHYSLAAITWVGLTWLGTAPFGRHAALSQVRVRLPAGLSWFLQELPTLLSVLYTCLYEIPGMQVTNPWSVLWELYEPYCTAGPSPYCIGRVAVGVLPELLPSTIHVLVASLSVMNSFALLLFVAHYVHRCCIYPLFLSNASRVPLHVTLSATVYCAFNGRLQVLAALSATRALQRRGENVFTVLLGALEQGVSHLAGLWGYGEGLEYTGKTSLLLFVLVLLGFVLWGCGVAINTQADYYLLRLRQVARSAEGKRRAKHDPVANDHYCIPYGGWFDYVSCPNFFGEMLEWAGYTLVMWTSTAAIFIPQGHDTDSIDDALGPLQRLPCLTALAAAGSFAIYTAANLLPRAAAHHRWYASTFGIEYTTLHRRAVLPMIY
eukprot:gene11103-7729_t